MTASAPSAPPESGPPGSLGDALSGRDNALNALRLLLAVAVLVWHSFVVLGRGADGALASTGATWAVNGFFAISGYLICGSRLRLRWRPFLWRRVLRIYPAYWVVLAVTGLVFAPLAALLGSGSTSVAAGLDYLVQNSTLWLRRYEVGHTLMDVPEQGLWNGSLWTLLFEFAAYLAAMVLLGAVFVRRHLTVTLAVLLVLITAAGLTGVGSGIQLPMDLLNQGIRLGGCFVAGMLVYSVRFRLPAAWPLALASLVITVGLIALPGLGHLASLPLAVALLSLGALLPTRVGAVNDISYGVYIYAFPVQQLLVVAAGTGWPVWLHALAALGLSVAAAWGSWLLVERPALRLAHRRRSPRFV